MMNDWIPVGERLPDKADWYFVTEILDTLEHDRIVTEAFYADDTGWRTNSSRTTVVAWMPKPEAYSGDRQGNIGYSDIVWHMPFTAKEVAVLDQLADTMKEVCTSLKIAMPEANQSVYNKIKGMTKISKTYPSKEKPEDDWVVRDKEPL
jgi:hypothetical protein